MKKYKLKLIIINSFIMFIMFNFLGYIGQFSIFSFLFGGVSFGISNLLYDKYKEED